MLKAFGIGLAIAAGIAAGLEVIIRTSAFMGGDR